MKITPQEIYTLARNECFVFGSNDAGIHGAGAALTAKKLFGAMQGVGQGRTGQCYAIATKDRNIQTLPLDEIKRGVRQFLCYARDHSMFEFLVTPIGCGLAGYSAEDIGPLFFQMGTPPENVSLPKAFWLVAQKECLA